SSYALALPALRIALMHDGRAILMLPPADDVRARLAALYGAGLGRQLLDVTAEDAGIRVNGVVGVPEAARSSREHQFFFVNGRPVQHALLSYLVRRSYGTMIPEGRYPFCVLAIEVPPEQVDVNVHPTKREVRFAREGDVSTIVARAVDHALRGLAHRFELL